MLLSASIFNNSCLTLSSFLLFGIYILYNWNAVATDNLLYLYKGNLIAKKRENKKIVQKI